MRLYLSSYRLGNHSDELKKLVNKPNAKVAVSVNALDFSTDNERKQAGLERELGYIQSLGFQAEPLDLRNYFQTDSLEADLAKYDAVWFSGGNVFLLAKAFKQSGFDKVIEKRVKTGSLVYSGYSAAFCVLSESLRGMELVDEKDVSPDGYELSEIWEGLGLIDFYPIVHFRSNHAESDDVEKEYEYVVKNNIPFKTFRDGDVYLVNGDSSRVLAS